MQVRARTIVIGLLVLAAILLIGAISAVGWQVVFGPKARAVTARKFDATPVRLARGQYLLEGPAPCFHCHTEHDLTPPELSRIAAKKGAGWAMPIPELGSLIAPNITPDQETGIGAWTDDEIARAIQEGVSRNGRALFPVMPYMYFRHLTDEDLASIVVYLRTIPAVRNPLPVTKLVFPLSLIVKTMPQPLTSHEPDKPRNTPEQRGEYLATTVAICSECHTPTDDGGQPLPGLAFAGGNSFHDPSQGMKPVFSVNITGDPSGIAHYDEAMFVQTIRTGRLPGRALSHIMPFENFKNMTDEDLHDIFSYLKSLPHVQHRISNTDPPAACPLCKHAHGLGELNKG